MITELFNVLDATRRVRFAYCDYIAYRIRTALSAFDPERIIEKVDREKSDLHPEGGYMLTTKKTIEITDRAGKKYRVTIQEID